MDALMEPSVYASGLGLREGVLIDLVMRTIRQVEL